MLTVPNTFSSVEAQGRIRLVKELKVIFEGKSEFCDDAGELCLLNFSEHHS